MKNKEKRTETIVARCTKKEKEQIVSKAKALGKSETQYIIDCCIAGTERKSDKIKKMHIQEVQVQEELNKLKYIIEEVAFDSIDEPYKQAIDQQMKKLGGKAKCQF